MRKLASLSVILALCGGAFYAVSAAEKAAEPAKEAAAASDTRVRRWDQLGADTATMWANYLTTPTVMNAQAMRFLNGTPTTAPLQAPEPQKA